ncbi:hypothetical protein [Salipiger sp. PrR003]|uniref:hypothetical protein n=1 Tax=Salipiger sp. PrR003 TaxID=2706776 RepID=UPI0013DACDB7|nr:hypothetical protein [Salipiger sp. PrR003]NDV52930.1 hypothetical protein [Salipiger sp. PrR003]
MNYREFEEWREREGLHFDTTTAKRLGTTAQTLRNWRARGETPAWVEFAALAISHGCEPMELTFTDVKAWQLRNSLETYEATAAVFGYKRQAVHQWFSRGSFPNWLAMAAPGYEMKHLLSAQSHVSEKRAS